MTRHPATSPVSAPAGPSAPGARGACPVCRRGDDRRTDRLGRDDRGSVTIEMALLVPALLALLGLAVATGRYESAASAVEGASAAAARAASLARTPGQAHRDATGIATTALTGQSPSCRDLAVSVDTSGFQTPATGVIQTGTPALVAVTVTCQIDLGDLGVPGLPGTKTISSRTVSVLDTFRAIT